MLYDHLACCGDTRGIVKAKGALVLVLVMNEDGTGHEIFSRCVGSFCLSCLLCVLLENSSAFYDDDADTVRQTDIAYSLFHSLPVGTYRYLHRQHKEQKTALFKKFFKLRATG